MKRIVVYFAQGVHRSELVAKAMANGIARTGGSCHLRTSASYRGNPEYDAAIFYGWAQGLRRIFEDYRKSRKAIYIDLGYWGRRKRTRYDGFHKLVLNSRHPTVYFQSRPHDSSRFKQFGLSIAPWRRDGRHILLAGMSGKAAAAEGFAPHEWERRTIASLCKVTDRPIIYRAKPNWQDARAIPGSDFQQGDVPLEQALQGCHAVVCHHSNVGVDALLAGVPVFSAGGVASLLGCRDLTQIESPIMPDGREQWAADLAWTQWSLAEMQTGDAYRYLLREGLV